MNNKQRRVLDSNLITWTRDLEIHNVLIYLKNHGIFFERHVEEISTQRTKAEKAMELIKLLQGRGPKAYDTFYQALLFCEQDHLAKLLESELLHPPDPNAKKPTHSITPASKPGDGTPSPPSTEEGARDPPEMENEPPSYEAVMKNQAFYKGYQVEKVAETLGLLENLRVEEVDSIPTSLKDSDVYSNYTKPKGLALVFNNRKFASGSNLPERLGTDVDAANILKLLTQLGYQTKVKHNLSASDMTQAMARFALKSEHRKYDSSVVVVLSHGTKGAIYGTDGNPVDVDRFVGFLNAENCRALREKPKLFFIQACRGERFDSGDSPDAKIAGSEGLDAAGEDESRVFEVLRRLADLDVTDARDMEKKIPTEADIFIAFATTPGFVSWRNSARGSWFIQAICQVFAEQANREDLLSLMTKAITAWNGCCLQSVDFSLFEGDIHSLRCDGPS